MSENVSRPERKTVWEKRIPWFVTISSSLVLIVIGYFLVTNIEWYKQSVFDENIKDRFLPEYRFYAYHMHLSMIKRSIGLFSGFSIMFLGMAVVFFSMKDQSTGEFKTASITAKIATTSPGIIAIVMGVILIISTIRSKDEFPSYSGPSAPQFDEPIRPPKPI